jgi:transcriptional regulator with XRE-family HTH domain
MIRLMPKEQHRRRTTQSQRRGQMRSQELAGRLGRGLREARIAAGRLQRQVAAEAGISQTRCSDLERGRGAGATIETWALAAEAVGQQFVAFLEHAPGAARPRDYEHIKRQQLVVGIAVKGGWRPMPEHLIDADALRSRSIDVFLTRALQSEAVVVEIWDWFSDVGDAMRGLDGKMAAVTRMLVERRDGPWRVGGLWVVRGTKRNRMLVGEVQDLFAAKFGGSPRSWLAALGRAATPMPALPGLVWTDVSVTRLTEVRLGRVGPGTS